jgi:hypothetical protein
MGFIKELDNCSDYGCIFKLVKKAVKQILGRRRVGLSLGLASMPNHIGAFHQLGSNFIIMNKNLLEEIMKTDDKKMINAYIFHVLLHEYIHSLGHVNEQETQILSHQVSENVLGAKHPATIIARYGLGSVFSGIELKHPNKSQKLEEIEIVEDFENENLSYIG